MNWQALVEQLFGPDHGIQVDGDFLSGTALLDDAEITVVGSTHHAAIGVALALKQARVILDTMAQHPGRAILLLVDTQGQQLRRRD